MEFIEILKVILLGIVEGITEWLPISSTGHMKLLNAFWSSDLSDSFMEMFEYVIQLGAIFAVVFLFWKDIFPFGLHKKQETEADSTPIPLRKRIVWKKDIFSLWVKVLIACIPAVVALLPDYLFETLCEKHELVEPTLISLTLILYGVLFIVIENYNKKKTPTITDTSFISYRTAFLIGCFQILAAIPGTSRSGITILGALLLGLDRTTASKFTFILAIPTMVGASAVKLLKFFLDTGTMSGAEVGYLLIGAAVAFAVSLVAIKFLMNFVKKHDFKVFGWYRIGLGVLVIATMVIPSLLFA